MRLPYFKVAMKNLFSKPSTENFPAVPKEAPEGYRGRIMFHPDKCIGCGLCIRVCSPGAITKIVEKQDDGDKITMEFDLSSCTFCQTCQDFCAKNAIELLPDYAMIAEDPDDLIVRGSFIKKKPVPRKPPVKNPTTESNANKPVNKEVTKSLTEKESTPPQQKAQ